VRTAEVIAGNARKTDKGFGPFSYARDRAIVSSPSIAEHLVLRIRAIAEHLVLRIPAIADQLVLRIPSIADHLVIRIPAIADQLVLDYAAPFFRFRRREGLALRLTPAPLPGLDG